MNYYVAYVLQLLNYFSSYSVVLCFIRRSYQDTLACVSLRMLATTIKHLSVSYLYISSDDA